MPAKKEAPTVEATPEVPLSGHPYFCAHIAAKVVICLIALFVGFSILIAAFGTGFLAGRFTSRGDGRQGMMSRGYYAQEYGRKGNGPGMINRGGGQYKNGPGQGKGQCPVYPGNQSYGSGSEELPPNNAPVTP
ncbi:MAG: hypothetical protein WC891_00740 [Actinomycetota bacterium]